ncbi:MAG: iron-sulfur cluster assembly scaffold protein [Candidatus Saganbacteria bacterium]|nr:iron-sulfur cluster assembly scaffold protein [Candidatus Saganbacteria bacterium]
MTEKDKSIYPEAILSIAKKAKHIGRMNGPDASAYVKGPCGDEMEFYLVINKGQIEDVKFYTDGCISTIVCGEITADLVIGKTLDGALGISPKQIKDKLTGLPQEKSHCSILAVTTLYRAIANYLLKP